MVLFISRDFEEKLNSDKEQKFKSENDALAFYKDTVKKINQRLFKIVPRDLITDKGPLYLKYQFEN